MFDLTSITMRLKNQSKVDDFDERFELQTKILIDSKNLFLFYFSVKQ